MADYALYYADLAKAPLVVTDSKTRGPTHPSSLTPDALNDGSLATPLLFYGEGVAGYGDRVQQNFLNLLENFSAPTAPATKIVGQLWHDSTTNSLKFWNGTTWVDILDSVDLSAALPRDGSLPMTGALTLSADPVSALQAATKQYVDAVFVGSGVNILPSNNNFTGKNWFRGAGSDPTSSSNAFVYAGNTVTSTTFLENTALSGGILLDGPTNKYVVGAAGRALIVSGTGNIAWGMVTEAWTYPTIEGILIGIEPAIIQQNNANTSVGRGIDVVFKNRPDGAAATTSALGANLFNNKAVAIAITSQTPSINGEYCGWTKGISFETGSLSRSTNQARAHLIDFYDATVDNASVNPLILTWKDRASTKRHGLMYNTANGLLEFWRDIYGTPARAGYISLESSSRDIDIVNGVVSQAGGDNITTDVSFTFSTPASFRQGQLWNSSVTHELTSWNGMTKTLDGSILVQTTNQTVAATTSELSILGTGVGSAAFPLNYFTPGKSLTIRQVGFFSCAAAQTLTVRIKLNSTVIASYVYTLSGAVTNGYFGLDFFMTCRAIGVTGSFIGQGTISVPNAQRIIMTSPVSINTTIAQALSITAEWSSNNALNTITTTNTVVNVVS